MLRNKGLFDFLSGQNTTFSVIERWPNCDHRNMVGFSRNLEYGNISRILFCKLEMKLDPVMKIVLLLLCNVVGLPRRHSRGYCSHSAETSGKPLCNGEPLGGLLSVGIFQEKCYPK